MLERLGKGGSRYWIPINEYQLFEKYWNRLEDYDNPGNREALINLVSTLFTRESSIYPWPGLIVRNAGVDGHNQKWLERKGWLNALAGGQIEIWHDRLLNWAVAEALIEYRRCGKYDLGEITRLITQLSFKKDEAEHISGKVLGYLPLDLMWLLINDSRLKEEAHEYLEFLETSEGFSGKGVLYKHLLPTLGENIIPAIITRILENSDDSGTHEIYASSCLVELGKISPDKIKEPVLSLLNEKNRGFVKIGLKVLETHPNEKALEQLWELTKAAHQQPSDCKNWHWQGDIYGAFRACIKTDPNWLLTKINKLQNQDSIEELAHQLSEAVLKPSFHAKRRNKR